MAIKSLDESDESGRRAFTDSASTDVWLEIINSGVENAHFVAMNKTIPPEIIAVLCQHESSYVRSAIAMKRAITVEQKQLLSKDEDASVRASIASNAKTPISILETLAQDSEGFVAEAARNKLESKRSKR